MLKDGGESFLRTRRLGNTDLELTVIGLGTWAIGGNWQYGWGNQNDDDSIAAINEAMDCGINWIDTAPIYGCGDSETRIGKALKGMSAKPIIATKCGMLWNERREKINCLEPQSIIKECEDSLRRLAVEVIDLYQMHWPLPNERIEDGWTAMATLQKQGKVRYIGVSNFNMSQLERIAAICPAASLQPPYSLINRDIEKELLPYCQTNNVGVICYSPMQKGLLTGAFSKDRMESLPADDVRHVDAEFNGKKFEFNLELVEQLKAVAVQSGVTIAQLAISWVLRAGEVTAAIVGARKKGQIAETVKAVDITLSNDNIEQIEELLAQRNAKISDL
jgi:aryl-alcohol dehydrogenase-like predicted oxidoreductase